MKPGTLALAVGSASGLVVVVVSVHGMLVYVKPPSVEIWTKPKSQPSSSFHSASNVSEPPLAVTCLTIAASRLFPKPE